MDTMRTVHTGRLPAGDTLTNRAKRIPTNGLVGLAFTPQGAYGMIP
jgi:hypothetical protein